MELKEALFNRRSVRKFTDHYVSNDDLHEMLEAARYAPSWANTQCWEFIIIRDRELIRQVTETYSETNPARKCSFDCSALVVACADTTRSGYKKGEQTTKFKDWFMFDLGMAVQNLCLRAHDLGLGTVIAGLMNHEAINKILSIPEGFDAVVTIPVGKPEGEAKPAPRRKELKDFVRLDTFPDHYTSIGS